MPGRFTSVYLPRLIYQMNHKSAAKNVTVRVVSIAGRTKGATPPSRDRPQTAIRGEVFDGEKATTKPINGRLKPAQDAHRRTRIEFATLRDRDHRPYSVYFAGLWAASYACLTAAGIRPRALTS
jgi:hypothetical protein